ncbi:MAG TPA: hypothetical protein VGO68_16380 [Pyrinomonadaceae bacterium]|jgi:hypothetical protein|nr:hypothetical protein [Pyrinomonadaceae bacterium]
MRRITLLISLVLCLGSSILGQTQTAAEANKSKTLEEVQNKIKTFKNAADFEAAYDKFDDKTTVLIKLGSPEIPKLAAYRINLMAWVLSTTFVGNGVSEQPVASRLCFDAFAGTANFAATKEIVFLLDGTRVAIGNADYNPKILPENIIGRIKEEVCWNLDASQLSALLNAKSIEFKAEPITGVFSEKNLIVLKDFQQLVF